MRGLIRGRRQTAARGRVFGLENLPIGLILGVDLVETVLHTANRAGGGVVVQVAPPPGGVPLAGDLTASRRSVRLRWPVGCVGPSVAVPQYATVSRSVTVSFGEIGFWNRRLCGLSGQNRLARCRSIGTLWRFRGPERSDCAEAGRRCGDHRRCRLEAIPSVGWWKVAVRFASVAQLAEQLICNQPVVGSNPSAGSCTVSGKANPPTRL